MKGMWRLFAAWFTCCVFGLAAVAAELGDPAAALRVEKWVKGKPVDLAACAKTNVVVVEFWATWCPPCRASIPHLTALQKKFAPNGALFVGISSEDAARVEGFVKEMGDKMDYSVAVDSNKATSTAYMDAFDVRGIPHAFVVDREGRIVWHGHPMDTELEKTVEQVMEGMFDIEIARKRAGAQDKLQALWQLWYSDSADEAQIKALSDELVALDKAVGGLNKDGSPLDLEKLKKSAEMNKYYSLYMKAIQDFESDARLEELVGKISTNEEARVQLRSVRAETVAKLYMQEATAGLTDDAQQAKRGGQLLAAAATNVSLLNNMAWAILTEKKIKKRDKVFALKLSKAAIDAGGGENPEYLDTYALALFENKQVKEAVEAQKKAVALVADPVRKQEITDSLKKYEASLPPAEQAPAKTDAAPKTP